MVFTKRERLIIAATVAVLCLLVLDVYVLSPLLDRRATAAGDKTRLVARLSQAQTLLERRRLLSGRWRQMLSGGMKRAPAEAESQLLRSLRDWSAEAGVRLSSLRPERSTEKSELPEITVHAAGSGSMRAVYRLLLRIEKAQMPVKTRMLQLGSRRDGTDDLSLQVRVSTLYLPEGRSSTEEVAGRPAEEGGDR